MKQADYHLWMLRSWVAAFDESRTRRVPFRQVLVEMSNRAKQIDPEQRQSGGQTKRPEEFEGPLSAWAIYTKEFEEILASSGAPADWKKHFGFLVTCCLCPRVLEFPENRTRFCAGFAKSPDLFLSLLAGVRKFINSKAESNDARIMLLMAQSEHCWNVGAEELAAIFETTADNIRKLRKEVRARSGPKSH